MQALAAFRARGFAWIWLFNAVGALGIAMQWLAQGWLVLTVTDSPFWVGAVFAMQGVGQIAFGALGGVLADRVDRPRALMAIQAVWGALALATGLLVLGNRLAVWYLMASGLVAGAAMGAYLPMTNSLAYDLVGPRLLLNAASHRATAFNLARVVGSLAVGALIPRAGIGTCYLVIGAVLLLAPAALFPLRSLAPTHRVAEPVWKNLSDGLAYVGKSATFRVLIPLSVLMELFGFSSVILLPVIARDVLHVDATGLGYLSAANGAGSLVGTLILAALGDTKGKIRLLVGTGLGAGVSLLLFALSSWFLVSLVTAALVGAALLSFDTTMATLIQLLSTDAMRSRVVGVYGLTFGFTPLGGFVSGSIAAVSSAPTAVGLGAIAILAYVLVVLLPRARSLQASPVPEPGRRGGPPS